MRDTRPLFSACLLQLVCQSVRGMRCVGRPCFSPLAKVRFARTMAEQRWQRDAAGCSGLSNADDEEALADLAAMTSAGTLSALAHGRSGPTIEAGSFWLNKKSADFEVGEAPGFSVGGSLLE